MAATKIRFENEYDKKLSGRFYRYYMLKNSSFMYLITIFGFVSLILLLTGFIKTSEDKTTTSLMWAIVVIGIVFVPVYTFMNIKQATAKDNSRRKGTTEVVEITKEKIVRVEVTSRQKMIINWLTIAKVVEVADAFYIFLGRDEAFIIKKSGLIEGSISEFRSLIYNYMQKDKKGKVPYVVKDKEYKMVLKQNKKQKKLAK